jgi:hypothetical protein
MPLKTLLLSITILLAADGAVAQVSYGGYDLGPDYGAMIQQTFQQQQMQNAQMQQMEQAIVQRAMQDPNCAAMYRQHQAQGGTLSYAQFAYQYAATGGFTPEGIARYRGVEADNQRKERDAWNGYRGAQDARAAAQQAWRDGYAHDQNEAGEVLRGNTSWVDPATGETRALSYTGANAYTDPQSGREYRRDDSGRYYVQGADGLWYPMTPAQ